MAVIGGFRSDLSITRKTDGNVSAGVLFSKVAKTVVRSRESSKELVDLIVSKVKPAFKHRVVHQAAAYLLFLRHEVTRSKVCHRLTHPPLPLL